MFSEASFSHSVHRPEGVSPLDRDPPGQRHPLDGDPPRQTHPPAQRPPGQRPSQTETPLRIETPWTETPLYRDSAQTQTPKDPTPKTETPWADPLPGATAAVGAHLLECILASAIFSTWYITLQVVWSRHWLEWTNALHIRHQIFLKYIIYNM